MLEYLRTKFDGHRTYAVTEEEQARGLVRVYLLSATVPWVERVYFFHLHQEAAYTGIAENVDHYMGLFTPWLEGQVRPKDAYFAVKTVIQVLNQSAYKGRIETPARSWCLHFERGNEATFALWCLDDAMTMTLKDASIDQERYQHGRHSGAREGLADGLRTASLLADATRPTRSGSSSRSAASWKQEH